MKKGKMAILIIGIVLSGVTSLSAQSRKERIELLTRRTDSLEETLSQKNESLVQLQIKLARLEGIKDTHNEEIRRLENKADSLKATLIARNMIIESQAAKITQLNTDINGLQAQQKEWTSKNEALTAELNTLKQKPADTAVALKDTKPADTKPADPPKEEVKTPVKSDPVVKN